MSEHRAPPVYLTTASGSFHAKVIAARLDFEGVPSVLRGHADGPYPLPSVVDVFVPPEQLAFARELLLGDQVDAAFAAPVEPSRMTTLSGRLRSWRRGAR